MGAILKRWVLKKYFYLLLYRIFNITVTILCQISNKSAFPYSNADFVQFIDRYTPFSLRGQHNYPRYRYVFYNLQDHTLTIGRHLILQTGLPSGKPRAGRQWGSQANPHRMAAINIFQTISSRRGWSELKGGNPTSKIVKTITFV